MQATPHKAAPSPNAFDSMADLLHLLRPLASPGLHAKRAAAEAERLVPAPPSIIPPHVLDRYETTF